MSQQQKDKLLHPMSSSAARHRLLEIYAEKYPGVDFMEKYPNFFAWAECWSELRTRSEGINVICQAFAEKISNSNKQKCALEKKLALQRKEIARLSKKATTGVGSEVSGSAPVDPRITEMANEAKETGVFHPVIRSEWKPCPICKSEYDCKFCYACKNQPSSQVGAEELREIKWPEPIKLTGVPIVDGSITLQNQMRDRCVEAYNAARPSPSPDVVEALTRANLATVNAIIESLPQNDHLGRIGFESHKKDLEAALASYEAAAKEKK